MTYIPVEVFIECMRTSGIKDRYEYYELHRRGIVPTDLMPKNPAIEYNNTYQKAYRQTSKSKAWQKAYQQSPKHKAAKRTCQQSPKYKAYHKAYREST